MNTTLTQATYTDTAKALASAYVALGVREFSGLAGVYVSAVQHSAAKTSKIVKEAQARLARRGLVGNIQVFRCKSGEAMYKIVI